MLAFGINTTDCFIFTIYGGEKKVAMTVIEWYYSNRATTIHKHNQKARKKKANQYTKIKYQCDIISKDILFVRQSMGVWISSNASYNIDHDQHFSLSMVKCVLPSLNFGITKLHTKQWQIPQITEHWQFFAILIY